MMINDIVDDHDDDDAVLLIMRWPGSPIHLLLEVSRGTWIMDNNGDIMDIMGILSSG